MSSGLCLWADLTRRGQGGSEQGPGERKAPGGLPEAAAWLLHGGDGAGTAGRMGASERHPEARLDSGEAEQDMTNVLWRKDRGKPGIEAVMRLWARIILVLVCNEKSNERTKPIEETLQGRTGSI